VAGVLVDEAAWPRRTATFCILVGLALVLPLDFYNLAIDHSDPRTGWAAAWLAVTLLGCGAFGVAVRRRLGGRDWTPVLLGGLLFGLLAAFPAFALATDYGKEGGKFLAGLGPLFFLAVHVVGLGLTAIVAAVVHRRSPRAAARLMASYGVGLAAGVAYAAVLMLATLPLQAEHARAANEAPGLGVLISAALLLALAAGRRRAGR
jgi:hypothetical protein